MRMFGFRYYDSDPVDPELPEHLSAVHRADWVHLIARLKIKASRQRVAEILASFASEDGDNVRPALQTVGDMCGGLHENSVSTHIKALIALGMLVVKTPGGGRSNPTLYRLTRPVDLASLPLWLDPDMKRIPAGSDVLRAETPTPTQGNESSSNTDSRASELPNTYSPTFTKGVSEALPPKTPMPTLPFDLDTPTPAQGYRPVDKSAGPENLTVFDPKPHSFDPQNPETPMPTWGDLLQADQKATNNPGLRQATHSLGQPEADDQPPMSVGSLVESPDVEPWVPEAEPPTPRTAPDAPPPAAMTLGAPAGAAVAFAILAALPAGGEWYRARAARELRREGITRPTSLDIAIRAVALLHAAETETRSA